MARPARMDTPEWRDQVYGPDERLHVLDQMPDNPVCPNPKCGYVLTAQDEQDVWQSDGMFHCPKCLRNFQLFDPNEFKPGGGTVSTLTLRQVGDIGEAIVREMGTIPGLGTITEDLSHLGKAEPGNAAPDFVIGGNDGVFYAAEVKTNDARAQERFKTGGYMVSQAQVAMVLPQTQ